MNSCETLFFPETTIFNEKRYPLLLFFTPLHFLQVVESRPGSVLDAEAELFLKSGKECRMLHMESLLTAYLLCWPLPSPHNRDCFCNIVSI